MIYIIFGDEPLLVKQKIDSLIIKDKDALLTKIDASNKEFDTNLLLDACKNTGLFNETSLVLVKDPVFLMKKIEENQIENLLEYCKKPLYETDLVFYTFDNSFNEKLKIFKDLAINAEVIKLNQLQKNDFHTFAHNVINNSKLNITKEASDYLINNVNLSVTLFNQNIEVLSLYPDTINLDVVKNLMTPANIDDVFVLINALTAKNVSLSINYANKLLENDESILKLLSSLAYQLRFLYSVDFYRKEGKTKKDIMNILNIKSSYRIEKAYETLSKVNSDEILDLLSKLSDLDYKLKKNDDIDEKLRLQLFIVGLLK